MIVIRFNVFYKSISINTVTEYHSFDEIKEAGVESVIESCLQEIKNSLEIDFKELLKPHDYLNFCSFIFVQYNSDLAEPIEKDRWVLGDSKELENA